MKKEEKIIQKIVTKIKLTPEELKKAYKEVLRLKKLGKDALVKDKKKLLESVFKKAITEAVDYKMIIRQYFHLPTTSEMTVIETSSRIEIYFPGSNGLKDWLQNIGFLAFPCKPYHNMKEIWFTHQGLFQKWKAAFNASWKSVLVKQVLKSKKDIYIIGYSQGHAMAVYCHELLKFYFPKIKVKTFTFGGPKVFLRIGRKLKNRLKDITQYQYENDIVTKIPFLYRNGGKTVVINPKNRNNFLLSLKDHRVKNYRKWIPTRGIEYV